MKKAGLIFIVVGSILCSIALTQLFTTTPFLKKGVIIMLTAIGSPLLNLGIAFRFIERDREDRKTAFRVMLFLSLFLMAFGMLSKYLLHAPGAGVEIIMGTFLFCFGFGPLLTKSRYEKWSEYVGSGNKAKLLSLADYFSITLILLGLLYKAMHWPGATVMLYIGLAILPITIFAWNRILGQQLIFRREAEKDLENAWEELSEKNNEIVESITYAKRIQEAILPSNQLLNKYLPDSFVLYLPKDIVAGDFYWFEQIGAKSIFAAADCTGHGVPGAMVSVVCHNALNRAVREFGLTDPGKILDKVRELVNETFDKSDREVKDGMDVALCVLEEDKLLFSGANNPLWIYRSGIEKMDQIEEIKGDKQPIGKFENPKPFSTSEVQLSEGDSFYVFSDGFPDQFGGPKGKKYKYKTFKNFILKQQGFSMDSQKEKMHDEFDQWKGSLEQLDDVCIIGVKI